MSGFKEGRLLYDSSSERMTISFYDDSSYGGLHCGECFEIKQGSKWIPVRIELGSWWYLEDENQNKLNIDLYGLEARI